MKKTINIGLAGQSFTIDEDAYVRLDNYLKAFRSKTDMGAQTNEVMDGLEERIAELFTESLGSTTRVVDLSIVLQVISRIGMPDGSSAFEEREQQRTSFAGEATSDSEHPVHKLYRDTDNRVFGGVCSGIAAHLGCDVTLIRIIAVIALFFGSAGGWIYVILWIVAPKAITPTQKCELRGWPVNAENLAKFSSEKK